MEELEPSTTEGEELRMFVVDDRELEPSAPEYAELINPDDTAE
jgi:hypothetical protein